MRASLPVLDALVDELVKRPPKSTTRDYVESIGAAILIALALRAFVIEAFKIPSSSMYPTLEIGDHIFVNKFIYGVRIPWTNDEVLRAPRPAARRGDRVQYPCDTDRDYIKRVVALAGDTVEVRCNVVYVNGKAIPTQDGRGRRALPYKDYDERDDELVHAAVQPLPRDRRRRRLRHVPRRRAPAARRASSRRASSSSDARDFPTLGHAQRAELQPVPTSRGKARRHVEQVKGTHHRDSSPRRPPARASSSCTTWCRRVTCS